MHTEDLLHIINSFILIPVTFLCRVLLVVILGILFRRWYVAGKKKSRVTVAVLGDVGRSPRMQYHALSLAQHGFKIEVVGYGDSSPHHKIVESSNISLHFLRKECLSTAFPRIFAYIIKVILNTAILLTTLLFKVTASEYILMQNPPCIPVLFVCWVISIINGSKLVIDWHNYGYTILGLTLGKNHKLVTFAHWYEKTLGQLASRDICVTEAMQKDLEDNWHIHAIVLYDRPPDDFRPLEVEEKHALFSRLKAEYNVFGCESVPSDTIFTKSKDGGAEMREGRPALIISSTSWTEDEDFSILLNALKLYEDSKSKNVGNLPDVICAITGKGPMKDYYLGEIKKINWKHVKIITPWLTTEDYPLLVGSADLGICLHTSSSGLDLPMKVVDMFGCGVPVAAIGFNCLHELVKDGENGVIFQNEKDLHKQLCDTFEGFPENQKILQAMRENLRSFRESSWSKNWDENVLPLFKC